MIDINEIIRKTSDRKEELHQEELEENRVVIDELVREIEEGITLKALNGECTLYLAKQYCVKDAVANELKKKFKEYDL